MYGYLHIMLTKFVLNATIPFGGVLKVSLPHFTSLNINMMFDGMM